MLRRSIKFFHKTLHTLSLLLPTLVATFCKVNFAPRYFERNFLRSENKHNPERAESITSGTALGLASTSAKPVASFRGRINTELEKVTLHRLNSYACVNFLLRCRLLLLSILLEPFEYFCSSHSSRKYFKRVLRNKCKKVQFQDRKAQINFSR